MRLDVDHLINSIVNDARELYELSVDDITPESGEGSDDISILLKEEKEIMDTAREGLYARLDLLSEYRDGFIRIDEANRRKEELLEKNAREEELIEKLHSRREKLEKLKVNESERSESDQRLRESKQNLYDIEYEIKASNAALQELLRKRAY